MNNGKLIRLVTFTVTLMWVISLVVGIIDRRYTVPTTVQLSMGAVCGYLFGQQLLSKRHGKDETK